VFNDQEYAALKSFIKERSQKEEAQEEDSANNLPRQKAVLDHTNTVLAVGEGRRGAENR